MCSLKSSFSRLKNMFTFRKEPSHSALQRVVKGEKSSSFPFRTASLGGRFLTSSPPSPGIRVAEGCSAFRTRRGAPRLGPTL